MCLKLVALNIIQQLCNTFFIEVIMLSFRRSCFREEDGVYPLHWMEHLLQRSKFLSFCELNHVGNQPSDIDWHTWCFMYSMYVAVKNLYAIFSSYTGRNWCAMWSWSNWLLIDREVIPLYICVLIWLRSLNWCESTLGCWMTEPAAGSDTQWAHTKLADWVSHSEGYSSLTD